MTGEVLPPQPLPDCFPVESAVGPYDQHCQCHQSVNACIQGNMHQVSKFHVCDEHPEHEDLNHGPGAQPFGQCKDAPKVERRLGRL